MVGRRPPGNTLEERRTYLWQSIQPINRLVSRKSPCRLITFFPPGLMLTLGVRIKEGREYDADTQRSIRRLRSRVVRVRDALDYVGSANSSLREQLGIGWI